MEEAKTLLLEEDKMANPLIDKAHVASRESIARPNGSNYGIKVKAYE